MEIPALIYRQYICFGPFFEFILAMACLISREKLRENYIYSLSYLFMGLGMIQVISYSMKPFAGYFYTSHFFLPFMFGIPFFLYLCFRFMIQGSMMRIHPVAAVFFAVFFMFLVAGLFLKGGSDFTENHAAIRPLCDPSFAGLPFYYKAIHILNLLCKVMLGTGFLILLFWTMYLWRTGDTGRIVMARIAYMSMIAMFLTSLLFIAGDIFSFAFSRAALAMAITVTIGVFFASQYDPRYYVIFKYNRKRKKYNISKIRGMDVESIVMNLGRLMNERRLYREEKLSLKSLADLIDINPQQLSEILNRDLGKSFSAYVNDFRIPEAGELLAARVDLTVIRIALMVGFNSVRTFNRVFNKKTGMTPVEYRKKYMAVRTGPSRG